MVYHHSVSRTVFSDVAFCTMLSSDALDLRVSHTVSCEVRYLSAYEITGMHISRTSAHYEQRPGHFTPPRCAKYRGLLRSGEVSRIRLLAREG
jgi:hypothetical protein